MNAVKVLTDVTRTAIILRDHMLVAVEMVIVLIEMDLLATVCYC